MKLYIAAIYNSSFGITSTVFNGSPPNMQALRAEVGHILDSYHYIAKGSFTKKIRQDKERIFLDSGAFSSFSLGVDVDINAYAQFCKDNADIIEVASVLDAIGDPVGTYHNQHTLERLGVEVLPCFHYGEPWDLCEYYVRNYEYITIGGMVPIANSKLEPWLDELWYKVLTDKDGYSRVKVHGFGMTSRYLMTRYPWYSCDSSSWVQTASNGMIVLPEFDRAISISKRSPNVKSWGQHFDTMPPMTQQKIVECLHYYGLTLEEVQHDYRARWSLCAFAFDRIGRLLGDDHWRKPFKHTYNGLF